MRLHFLRANHGFLLEPSGWSLAPAYDMNPNHHGTGLKLNISETGNTQELELAREVERSRTRLDAWCARASAETEPACGRLTDGLESRSCSCGTTIMNASAANSVVVINSGPMRFL